MDGEVDASRAFLPPMPIRSGSRLGVAWQPRRYAAAAPQALSIEGFGRSTTAVPRAANSRILRETKIPAQKNDAPGTKPTSDDV